MKSYIMMTSVCCILLICLYLAAKTNGAKPLYIAEGLILVDDETVKSYMRDITNITDEKAKREMAMIELQKDVNYTLSELNNLFKSMKHMLQIEIYVRKLEFLSDGTFPYPPLVPGTLNGMKHDAFLLRFKHFLQTHNYYDIYKFDFAILWTGFVIHDSDGDSLYGAAQLGKICKSEDAIGVVLFDKTYDTPTSTAHEIGHILGAEHGSPLSRHIMAYEVFDNSAKRWYFSNYSAGDIKEYIESFKDNCLLNTSADSYRVTVEHHQYTGRIYNVDDICRRHVNKTNAYMVRIWRIYDNLSPSGNHICSRIYCAIPGSENYTSAFSSDGMVCNPGKRCRKGKCKTKDNTPTDLTPNCLFGDTPLLELSSENYTGTCEDFLNKTGPFKCYRPEVQENCCRTCQALHSGITDCTYGDHEVCKFYSQEVACQTMPNVCCTSCRYYVANGKRSEGLLNKTEIPEFKMPKENIVLNHAYVSKKRNKYNNQIVV